MNISPNSVDPNLTASQPQVSKRLTGEAVPLAANDEVDETREAFKDFVGQTFFSQMIQSLRSTQQPSEYFHGGRAEEVFQGQFDQMLSQELSDASADKVADPMFELFMLGRSK